MAEHRLPLRIYLEDTDAQGIVFHANYLRYFERARTEILMAVGASPVGFGEQKLRFVVHEARLKYHRPALLGDKLEVRTRLEKSSPFRLSYDHRVFREGESKPLVEGTVEIVCIDPSGELTELPAELMTHL